MRIAHRAEPLARRPLNLESATFRARRPLDFAFKCEHLAHAATSVRAPRQNRSDLRLKTIRVRAVLWFREGNDQFSTADERANSEQLQTCIAVLLQPKRNARLASRFQNRCPNFPKPKRCARKSSRMSLAPPSSTLSLKPRISLRPRFPSSSNGRAARKSLRPSGAANRFIFRLENGDNLLVHLGMTGKLHVERDAQWKPEELPRHVHGAWRLDNGLNWIFTDPRTFGELGVSRELPFLTKMGPEPLDDDFPVEQLIEKLQRRNVKIKNAILDQTLIAGLGNIYAGRSLFSRPHSSRNARQFPVGRTTARIAFAHEAHFARSDSRARRDAQRRRLSRCERQFRRVSPANVWANRTSLRNLRNVRRTRRSGRKQIGALFSLLSVVSAEISTEETQILKLIYQCFS